MKRSLAAVLACIVIALAATAFRSPNGSDFASVTLAANTP